MKINSQHATNKGFSMVEMIVYIAVLTIFTTGIVVTVVSLFETKNNLEAQEEIAYSATLTLERITREIRRARSIDLITSTFESHPGSLKLITTDFSDNPTTVTISLVGTTVVLQEGLSAPYPLSKSSVDISNLVFTRYATTETEAVMIELTVEKNVRDTLTTKNYRTFVTLDG